MQITNITVNAAEWNIADRRLQGTDTADAGQAQAENSSFGPECRVTISREGKALSRQQAEQDAQGAQGVREEKKLLRRQEEAERAKDLREGYREALSEIDRQITEYNTASYGSAETGGVSADEALLARTVEELKKIKEAMQDQKAFQKQESERRMREAQQLQLAQSQEEVDENNRDLLTLLKTMKAAEKAQDGQEGGGADGRRGGAGAAGTDVSAGSAIQNSASQFMAASTEREMNMEGMLADYEDSGRWLLDTADSITRNVLQRSADIRAALEDESFTDGQIAEMMQTFQEEMRLNNQNVRDFRSVGTQILRNVRELKIQHAADDPQGSAQETKKSLMLSAADAALGEAEQGSLDRASRELADEVRELIDERNDRDTQKPVEEEKQTKD